MMIPDNIIEIILDYFHFKTTKDIFSIMMVNYCCYEYTNKNYRGLKSFGPKSPWESIFFECKESHKTMVWNDLPDYLSKNIKNCVLNWKIYKEFCRNISYIETMPRVWLSHKMYFNQLKVAKSEKQNLYSCTFFNIAHPNESEYDRKTRDLWNVKLSQNGFYNSAVHDLKNPPKNGTIYFENLKLDYQSNNTTLKSIFESNLYDDLMQNSLKKKVLIYFLHSTENSYLDAVFKDLDTFLTSSTLSNFRNNNHEPLKLFFLCTNSHLNEIMKMQIKISTEKEIMKSIAESLSFFGNKVKWSFYDSFSVKYSINWHEAIGKIIGLVND
mmetsp:Transcript_14256/g.21549  ORF Transcript_14256/g.21549 Transcript_14256/m.21549 type:complete len:326 (-) Transcript_14256:1563-2540(-)